jgi:hypothetical protein
MQRPPCEPDPDIIRPGSRVIVTKAWRSFHEQWVGKVGYVVAACAPGVSFDFDVKFPNKRFKRMPTLEEVNGAVGHVVSFRATEIRQLAGEQVTWESARSLPVRSGQMKQKEPKKKPDEDEGYEGNGHTLVGPWTRV